MHIQSVTIRNLRAFRELKWELPVDPQRPEGLAGWHVIIGDNGSGKTSFLRCVALALCGPLNIHGLREEWRYWLRDDSRNQHGSVDLTLKSDADYEKGDERSIQKCEIVFGWVRGAVEVLPKDGNVFRNIIWAKNQGWFSAAFGPFRRFTGGDHEQERLFSTHPILARHLSVFGENIALTEALQWLENLRFQQLEKNEQSGALLTRLTEFVNQPDFLPHDVKLTQVTSKGVIFRNPQGQEIDVTQLSDGFRSILSMTFELIRQLVACYGEASIFSESEGGAIVVKPPGVVLIDEVDVHLHPTWQRRIGQWFTRHFPAIQFIVTTHSPLVCQAAENGSIFQLGSAGDEDSPSGFVTGAARERLIYGDILDAYSTGAFGDGVNRSDSGAEKVAELARLNQKALEGNLDGDEAVRHAELSSAFSHHLQTPF